MNNKINSHLASGAFYKSAPFLALLMIVFITNALVACKSNTATTPPTATQAPIVSTDSSSATTDSVQSQNNAIRVQVDELTTRNSKLDSQIMQKDVEIAKLKSKMGHLQRSNRSLAAQLKKDKKFIASLKDELSDKARSLAERIGLLESDKSSLVSERDALLDKYNKLKDLGSVLHASNIKLMAVHLRHHGTKERNTTRARKADELKVSFDIDENRIAEDGTKKLYVVIKDPSGNLLSAPSIGGTMTTSKGNQLNYSIAKEIPLKQDEPVKDITVDWKQDSDYTKGVYSIAIYNGGYKIGGGDVYLN